MTDTIHDTDNYFMRVGTVMIDANNERALYQVVHKEHGVIEYEDSYYSRTVEAMHNLETKLKDLIKPDVEPLLSLVETLEGEVTDEEEPESTPLH